MAVRIKDVAKKAGVSTATVSRVINDQYVSPDLKNRVLAAIKELKYRPDYYAKGLRTNRTFTVGMVLPDISNPHFPLIFRGAEDELRKSNVSLIMANSDGNSQYELEAIRMLFSKHIDGLLFISSGYNKEVEKEIIESGIPTVFVGRKWENKFPSLSADSYKAMMEMLNYLYETDHRNLLFLGGPDNISSSNERLNAFINFSDNHENMITRYITGNFSYESGYDRTLATLMNNKADFDAIVCANDLIAYGAIDACKSLNLKIPEQLSVTGFDDSFTAEHFSPSLTTVALPTFEMGRKAAELLSEYIENTRKGNVEIVLSGSVVIRNSTAKQKIYNYSDMEE